MEFTLTKLRPVFFGLLAAAVMAGCASGNLPEQTIVLESPSVASDPNKTDEVVMPHETSSTVDTPAATDEPSVTDAPPSDNPGPSETPPAAENPPATEETPPLGGIDFSNFHFQAPPAGEGSLGSRLKDYLPKVLEGGGLYVENTSTLLGNPKGAAPQLCNAVPRAAGDAGQVLTALKVTAGEFVKSVSIGCEDVGKTEDPSVAPEMQDVNPDQEGVSATVQAPLGFAFSGYAVRTCNYGGQNFLAGFQPLAKRIETWGMNDDIEWQGPKFQDPKFQYTILDPRCGDWVEERCENGSVLTGITENTLKISSPLPGMAPQEVLSAVVGICQPVKSKTQAKPVVGKITLEETTIDAKVGLVGYRRPAMCPLGTIVAGIKYSQTDQFDHCDGDTVVPSVELDCVSLKDGSHYATGSAGQNFFEYDWNDDLSVYNHPNRVDFFPGFGAHALRVWTIENRQNFLAGFRFDQTPVDLPRKENAVWTGSHKEYSFLSAKAGGDGGNEKVISCPDHQVLTGVNFWVVIRKDAYRWKDGMEQRGVTEVLNGIESIRCSRVNVE